MVCLGNICINTLHKGANDDDDEDDNNNLKYRDRTIRIKRMWNVKNENETSNNRGKWNHLNITQKISQPHSLPGKHKFNKLQTTATMGTAHVLRKVLM
jgi:hypothetical protein